MYKMVISYDMKDGKEEECQRYFAQTLAPALNESDMQVAEVWYTIWGSSPQILSGVLVDTLEDARHFLKSDQWGEILGEFGSMATNLKIRLVEIEAEE